jgi:hypothetical protein
MTREIVPSVPIARVDDATKVAPVKTVDPALIEIVTPEALAPKVLVAQVVLVVDGMPNVIVLVTHAIVARKNDAPNPLPSRSWRDGRSRSTRSIPLSRPSPSRSARERSLTLCLNSPDSL